MQYYTACYHYLSLATILVCCRYETDVLRPILARDLMTTAYMFKSCPPHQRVINEILPCCVKMSDVAVDLGLDALPANAVCKAINMQMMALCITPADNVSRLFNCDMASMETELGGVYYLLAKTELFVSKCGIFDFFML